MRLRQRPGLTTRLRGLTGPALILCLAMAAPARAAGLDLHWLWDDRCAECHGHSSEFARRLTWRSGELVLAHPIGDPLHFLRHHYPPADEVEPLYRMLQAQAATPPRFQVECGGCHDNAASLVRNAIRFRDGAPVMADSGRSVSDALAMHRGLTEEQRQFFGPLLTRVAREVHRP